MLATHGIFDGGFCCEGGPAGTAAAKHSHCVHLMGYACVFIAILSVKQNISKGAYLNFQRLYC